MGAVYLCYSAKDAEIARAVREQLDRFELPTAKNGPEAGQVVALIFGTETNEDAETVQKVVKAQELALPIFGLRTDAIFPRSELESSTNPIRWVNAIVGNIDGHIGRLVGQIAGDPSMRGAVIEPEPAPAPPPRPSSPPPAKVPTVMFETPKVEPAAPPVIDPPDDEKGTCVVLLNPGSNSLAVIKEIVSITGLGLVEAKGLMEVAPVTIKVYPDQLEAAAVCRRLLAIGALATIQAATTPAPPTVDLLQGLFDVRVLQAGYMKLEVIKAVRALTGWDLYNSKTFVDRLPQTLARVSYEEGAQLKQALEASGCTVVLEPAAPGYEPFASGGYTHPNAYRAQNTGCATQVLLGLLTIAAVAAFALC